MRWLLAAAGAREQFCSIVEQNYFPSDAYLNVNGQPVVTNFNVDDRYAMDWQAANGKLKVAPRFLFQDNGGFSHAMSDGSYSWVMPWAGDYGLGYLSNFYYTGLGFADKKTMGATYKGFNDKLASWGSNRFIDHNAGRHGSRRLAGQFDLSPGNAVALPATGYVERLRRGHRNRERDRQLFLAANIRVGEFAEMEHQRRREHGGSLHSLCQHRWPEPGEARDIPTGTYTVDLCSLSLPSDNYQLFVQAVGKPSMANRCRVQ